MGNQMLLGPNGLVFALKGDDGMVNLHWGGLQFYAYRQDDDFGKRMGIAILANQGVLQQTICELFGIACRHTVRNIQETYNTQGLPGLLEHRQGPRATEKALCEHVISSYARLKGTRNYQAAILDDVRKKAEEGVFHGTLSRSKLQKIIREHKDRTKRENEAAKKADDAKGRKKMERAAGSPAKEVGEAGHGVGQPELEERAGEWMCVEHGGAAAVIPLLGRLGLKEGLPAEGGRGGRLYSMGELAVCYAALNAARVVDVEQDFKLTASHQMGGMLGRTRLPSLSMYREMVPAMVERMDMRLVMLASSRRAAGMFGPTRVAYIDGHFMPCHGGTETLYGYSTQRRLAMHGREYICVHDENGVPIHASLSDGYRKMQYYVESLDPVIRGIYGAKEKEILEVFDRGGYSKDFCVGIHGRILFVCWRSDARETPDAPAGQWVDIDVMHQGNTFGETRVKRLRAWERTQAMEADGVRARFREIWIKSGNKTSPALSNDFDRPLGDLVRALVGRWGNQENMFIASR